MKRIVEFIALLFVGLFTIVWLVIAWRVWQFAPTTAQPRYVLSDQVKNAATLLAASVGAGTAAVLGITIQASSGDQTRPLHVRVGQAVGASPLLVAGVVAYAVVGFVVLGVGLTNPDEMPETGAVFGTGILGWCAGAFASVFKSSD